MRIVLLLALLAGGFYLLRHWLARQNRARLQRIFWLGLAGAMVLLLVTRAGATVLYAALPVLLPIAIALLRRQVSPPSGGGGGGRPFGWGGFGGGGSAPGGGKTGSSTRSQVMTRFLQMTLDHASGELDGMVIAGRFQGQRLDDLSEVELLDLWRECRADPRSVAVLETWLDRRLGDDWRERTGGERRSWQHDAGTPPPQGSAMDKVEAYAILGLHASATPEEIRAAHRRLMQRLHPDHGGSDYLAAQINQAKDVLLGRH